MINNIFGVIDKVYTEVSSTAIPTYKDLKPVTAPSECIVISYLPVYKNDYFSSNDIVLYIYTEKIGSMTNTDRIKHIYDSIKSNLNEVYNDTGVVSFEESQEPYTRDYMTDQTVTEIRFNEIHT